MAKNTEDIFHIAKKYANKKTILASLSFILILAVTILSSIPEFVITPSQVMNPKFFTKLVMTLIIGVTSLVCFILIGGVVNSMNIASDIYIARSNFRTSAEDILKHHYSQFKQWVERKRRPAKQKEVDTRLLRHVGITNLYYLELDECQLKNLITAPDAELAKQHGIKMITQEQFDVIMSIKNGKTQMQFLNVNDYLLEKTMGIDQTDEEMLVNQFKKRNWIFGEKIGSRVAIIIVFAVTLGCIGWSTYTNIGENMTQAQRTFTIVWDILTKLGTAASSALIGFFDGGKFNDFDANYLQIKTNVHTQYLTDKDFKPLSDEDLAKEEYLKYHQQQEEKERERLGLTTPLLEAK